MRRLAPVVLAAFAASCGPVPDADDQANRQAEAIPPSGSQPSEPVIDSTRATEIERVRRGSPGPTTPVYDPAYADEPGRSFATAEEAADYLEERERRRAREAAKQFLSTK